jgi:predicted N-acetyltransferase YhbS
MDILPLEHRHRAAVEALADLCFGPGRKSRTAALLRRGAPAVAPTCLVAGDAGRLVGSVQCHLLEWRSAGDRRDLLILGPLTVEPDRRGEGIGTALMDRSLAAADALGLDVMLIGDQPYYGRWGFSARDTGQWQLPGPVDRARLLLRTPAGQGWDAPAVLAAPRTACAA